MDKFLPSSDIVQNIQMDGSSVTFDVHQTVKAGSISWIAVASRSPNGDLTCEKIESVPPGDMGRTFSAACDSKGIAKVELYFHDGSFQDLSYIPDVPGICKPSSDPGKKILYTYEIPCTADCGPVVTLASTPESCPEHVLDFKGASRGQYITDDFKTTHGVTISATAKSGGYTPSNAARIFDSSNPGGSDGDIDLGTPNNSCGGPGVGTGGAKGSAYENCVPLGNVLIIQESNKATPDDNYGGGWITFDFVSPAHIDKIVILDSDGCEPVDLTVSRACHRP